MYKKILFVCLGNICRSPAAEAVFLDLIHQKGFENDFLVDSAGTGGWHIGRPADSRMRNFAEKRGIHIKSIARQIKNHDLENFDFIFTMDEDNLSSLQALVRKSGLAKTALIKPILSYSKSSDLLEVPDPYYGGDSGFEKVLDLLEDACTGLLLELRKDLHD